MNETVPVYVTFLDHLVGLVVDGLHWVRHDGFDPKLAVMDLPPWHSGLWGKHYDRLAGGKINGPEVQVTYQVNNVISLLKVAKNMKQTKLLSYLRIFLRGWLQ